jgi:hypothetical protein
MRGPVSSLRSATARSTSATGDRAGHSFSSSSSISLQTRARRRHAKQLLHRLFQQSRHHCRKRQWHLAGHWASRRRRPCARARSVAFGCRCWCRSFQPSCSADIEAGEQHPRLGHMRREPRAGRIVHAAPKAHALVWTKNLTPGDDRNQISHQSADGSR